jgi:predicted nucleotidyltransferase component of viral defense system
VSLPPSLAGALPAATAEAWVAVRDVLPRESYLGGGTAIAVHLAHRQSRDLDFFLEAAVDMARLQNDLDRVGDLHVVLFEDAPGRQTMEAWLGTAKLQVLEASTLVLVEPTSQVAGIRVAGMGDLLAMKLKVLRERGELRDYYDVLAIERDAHRRVEEGIALALAKYRPRGREEFVVSLLRSLAYLDDVQEDPAVPLPKAEIAAYWAARVPEIAGNLSRWG